MSQIGVRYLISNLYRFSFVGCLQCNNSNLFCLIWFLIWYYRGKQVCKAIGISISFKLRVLTNQCRWFDCWTLNHHAQRQCLCNPVDNLCADLDWSLGCHVIATWAHSFHDCIVPVIVVESCDGATPEWPCSTKNNRQFWN